MKRSRKNLFALLLSFALLVSLLPSNAFAAVPDPPYTPLPPAIQPVGFENSSASLALAEIGRYDTGITSADGGRLLTADEGEPRNGYDNGSTDPEESTYVNYINSRDFSTTLGADDSPEGLKFVPAAFGPTGKAKLLAACEVGGTVAAYELTSKAAPVVENPFTDITADDYYYEAVLWAVKHQIAKGTGDHSFSPDASCTRGQVVTFLHRDFQGE